MQANKAPVPVAKCHGCNQTIKGKFAIKSHQCRNGAAISRDDALALQRKQKALQA